MSNTERQYRDILESLNLTQHTRTTKSLIDHVISNDPFKVVHTYVLPAPSVSDHNAVYAIINARVKRYAPRHKYIRNEKQLDMQAFKQDFSSLALNVIYGLESPEDMVDALNSLVSECLDRHAT